MSASLDFFDSNVILYGIDFAAPQAKVRTARALVTDALARNSAVISWQVVQETLHVVAHKFRNAPERPDRRLLLQGVLRPLWKVQPSEALCEAAIGIQDRQGFAFYDSLIVAAALEAGCKRLLTEDLQHGQRIGGLRIENPFL